MESFTLLDHQSDMVGPKVILPASKEESSVSSKSDIGTRCGTADQKLQGNVTSGPMKVKEEPNSVIEGKSYGLKVSLLDCPHLFQSGNWLTAQLTPLFGPSQSKLFVLKLLKHCLLLSGRIRASCFTDPFSKQTSEHRCHLGRAIPSEVRDFKLDELQTLNGMKQIDSEPVKSKDETVDNSHLPLEVEAAIAAVHERAVLESYLKNLNYPSLSSKLQM